eukprot:6726549-Prorocentrum_lima.AAC.1
MEEESKDDNKNTLAPVEDHFQPHPDAESSDKKVKKRIPTRHRPKGPNRKGPRTVIHTHRSPQAGKKR